MNAFFFFRQDKTQEQSLTTHILVNYSGNVQYSHEKKLRGTSKCDLIQQFAFFKTLPKIHSDYFDFTSPWGIYDDKKLSSELHHK